MRTEKTQKPTWLTLDCYGTLIQWDEGLSAVMQEIARRHRANLPVRWREVLQTYDEQEFAREQREPFCSFEPIGVASLEEALARYGVPCTPPDADDFVKAIPTWNPFPEVIPTLLQLKRAGFRLCIISNSSDALMRGSVAQLGEGVINRVITAEQARAYKPDHRLFEYAWEQIGVDKGETCHICASPVLDHTVARDLGFRCIWIDRGTGRAPLDDYVPDRTLPRFDEVLNVFREWEWLDEQPTA